MKRTHDIIIIGAGSGGLNVAGFFSRLQLKVLLIDRSDSQIGGDCLNSGCVPSKALIHVANQIHNGNLSSRFLTEANTRKVDIKKITDYIKNKQDILREHENPEFLKNKGIEYIKGETKFVDKYTISINNTLYSAKHIVVATGSRPRILSVENDKSIREFNNETIFAIDYLPERFVFIGGGPINCELGQAFNRLGSHVTILNSGPRILEKEIIGASLLVEEQFKEEGITLINSTTIVKIAERKVWYKTSETGGLLSVDADAVFVGIGRQLNIENLDLEKASIMTDEKKTRLLVDEYLRTTNKHVYVVGDIAGNFQFTHAAEMHAKVVIGNIFSPLKKKFDARHIAWATYTTPEIATFGISEKEALTKGYEILNKSFKDDDRAVVDENEKGLLQLYVDKKGILYGGTMVGKNASEMSQELILAMSLGVSVSAFFNKVYPYPTGSRITKSISGNWMNRKLNSFTIGLLKILYILS